ncbi:Ig-like domain-containing protein [Clostridium sp. JS66]|uniref:Ig-like domain-containing protein n=1 Tax=Clostridium sp. JS66 TaxID=3064705 RepID=UPI00298E966B|nr:Ig-like domain-containing protein [Clostridium sp. JS66]WPC39667.1 thermonuclease family protein [Clostridium sp. JS66]
MLNNTVYLESDAENTERYSKYLSRYVWLSLPTTINENEIKTKMFNAIMLSKGYTDQRIEESNVKYTNYLKKFCNEAQQNKNGIWNTTNIKDFQQQNDVENNKSWIIKFNTTVDTSTLNQNINITDSNGTIIKTYLTSIENDKKFKLTPAEKYLPNEIYTINISKDVKSTNNKFLMEPLIKKFTTKGNGMSLASEYLKNKNYNIVEYNGEIDEYVLLKEMLLQMPYMMYWSVQDTNVNDYIGKNIKTFKFTVKNHALDNVEDNNKKSTLVYVIISNNKVIG